jgi:cytochrome c-type biogenesis protein CcmE
VARSRRGYYVGAAVVVVFGVFALLTFRATLTPYVSFDKARESETTVQVIGELVPGSIVYHTESGRLHFALSDSATSDVLPVSYFGIAPTNLEHAKNVVVVGVYSDTVFDASEVLVECPSKYTEGSDG